MIFGVNLGINFNAQICALKLGQKWLYYAKISFIGMAPGQKWIWGIKSKLLLKF